MNDSKESIAEQLAHLASRFQEQRTGHVPKTVAVVLGDDIVVVTLYDALTPAEAALAKSPDGAAQVQEFHRQLFAISTEEMRREMKRIMGRQVREAAAEIETATGTVVHAFTTGAMVQVFLLAPGAPASLNVKAADVVDATQRADDDGLRISPEIHLPDGSKS
jgi:uncharacterized protein YbcI